MFPIVLNSQILLWNLKMGVVVVSCLLILCGLFVYLWQLDKKISRLEKEMYNGNPDSAQPTEHSPANPLRKE